jgi:Cutinase
MRRGSRSAVTVLTGVLVLGLPIVSQVGVTGSANASASVVTLADVSNLTVRTVAKVRCVPWIFIGARGSGESATSVGGLGTRVGELVRRWWEAMDNKFGRSKAQTGSTMSILALNYVAYPVPFPGSPSSINPIDLAGWALQADAGLHAYVIGAQGGVDETRVAIQAIRTRCTGQTQILAIGYSQGAWLMGRVASNLNQGQVTAVTPVEFILLSDPAQKTGDPDLITLQIHPYAGYSWGVGGTENGIETVLQRLPLQPSWASNYELMTPRTFLPYSTPSTNGIFVESVCADGDFVCDTNLAHVPSGMRIHTTYYTGYSDKADATAMNALAASLLPRPGH